MNTTKFDNLVIASRRAAENSLASEPCPAPGGQPGSTQAGNSADAQPGQAGTASQFASQPQQAQPQNGGATQKKQPAAKRKRDDSKPKRPRGRPRKYPLPADFQAKVNGGASKQNGNAASPQAARMLNGMAPASSAGTHTPVTSAPLSNGVSMPSGAQQNGGSQPGMGLYDAWSKHQGTGVLGSPSKQAALYAMRNQQQQTQAQQQQQTQQDQQQQAGQALEHFEFPPNGFMALMQEYAPALAGAFQDGSLAAFGFPAHSPQPAHQAAASAPAVQNPPVINNPQGPLPVFSEADAVRQNATPPMPQGVFPGLTTRSPSRRKPQKSPIKPQQSGLANNTSPARMQHALNQGIPASSPAPAAASPTRAAASPMGRSRAQRKNAATPQRVVPGAAAGLGAQPAAAAAPSTQQPAAAATAIATPEGMQCQAGTAGAPAQLGASGPEKAAGASKAAPHVHPKPSDFALDDDPSSFSKLQPDTLKILLHDLFQQRRRGNCLEGCLPR